MPHRLAIATGRRLIAGNWKMNGLTAELAEIEALRLALGDLPAGLLVAVCPPATLIAAAARVIAGSGLLLGGQDCHEQPGGAFTGDLSARMLADAGASLVIVGHSERRSAHGEDDALVAAKAAAAVAGGLVPIVCLGETEAQYLAGETHAVVRRQLAGSLPAGLAPGQFVVAYEPVWAIGTGRTPTREEIAAVHATLGEVLTERLGPEGGRIPLLYGGSVKPDNAADILCIPGVGGALVGGASLAAESFAGIVRSDPSQFHDRGSAFSSPSRE